MLEGERVAGLRRVSILAGLSDTALARIARDSACREYKAGQHILEYQDASTDVAFLLRGKARAIVYSSEGKAVIFTDLQAGAMFGEIAAIDRGPRSASIEAIEDCTIALLTADQFEALMLREPSVAVATLRHVTSDVRRLSDRVFEFSTMIVRNRIHAELLRLIGDVDRRLAEALLCPAPSLSEIADRISTHREAVSREIARLIELGLLRREGKNLKITSVARLTELVNEARGERGN